MRNPSRYIILGIAMMAILGILAGCSGAGSAPAPAAPTSAPKAAAPTSAPAAAAPTTAPAQAAVGSGEVIKIGWIGPLSGSYAYTGESIKKGAELAVKEANAEGGKIEMLVGDDRGTPAEAVALAQKYINDDKIAALVGPFNTATVLPVKDIANKAKVPMASTGAAGDNVTEKDVDYYFRPHMYNNLQSSQFAKYIVQELGKKKLGIIYENNDWGKGLDTSMSKLFEDMGAEMVAREGFNSGTTDFTSSLTKLKASSPDGYVAIALITEAAIIARQASELGISGANIIGLGSWDQDKLFELVGPATDGIKFMMWYAPEHPEIKAAKVFSDAYQTEFGSVPDSFAAQGYTAAKSLLLAIKAAGGTDGTAIRDAMLKTDFESPIGNITFGPDHNARASVFMAEWKDGKKVLLPKQPKID